MNKASKTVLLLAPSYYPDKGGVASVVANQAQSLERAGFNVYVITKRVTPERNTPNVFEITISYRGFPFYASGVALRSKSQVVVQVNEIIERVRPDILISHCWMAWNTDLIREFKIPDKGIYC